MDDIDFGESDKTAEVLGSPIFSSNWIESARRASQDLFGRRGSNASSVSNVSGDGRKGSGAEQEDEASAEKLENGIDIPTTTKSELKPKRTPVFKREIKRGSITEHAIEFTVPTPKELAELAAENRTPKVHKEIKRGSITEHAIEFTVPTPEELAALAAENENQARNKI